MGKFRNKKLLKIEMKEYQKFMRNLSWLVMGTQLDLSYTVLKMSQKNNSTMIEDLHNVNKVVKKVKAQKSEVYYGRVEMNRGIIAHILINIYEAHKVSLANMSLSMIS